MSKIALKPNASGTGVFSLEAPNSNVDRTLTLPDEQGTVATIENIPPGYEDQDALDLFNVTGSAPVYACRAWVNFDGTGTVSIRASGNVSSITDVGTGLYEVNFTTGMPDNDYVVVGNSTDTGKSFPRLFGAGAQQAVRFNSSGFGVTTFYSATGNFQDMERIKCAVFR